MAKFIRWQGLVAFVVLSALIAVFVYLFAESLAKSAIVASAESAFGAEVNVETVELAYSPLQISVIGLQVTDKENPTHNLFSFNRATAAVDVWQYLFGKIIVDQLEVSELAFASKRTQTGQVFLTDKNSEDESESISDQAKAMLPEMDMKLPDVKTLLNDSNLLTVKAGETLKASYKAEQEKIKALKAQLPKKEKLKYYQDKVKALGNVKVKTLDDIAKIKNDYEKIKAEFKADQAFVKSAKQQIVTSKNLLAQQAKDVKNAPGKDWNHIEKTYQLESIDGEDFAHILFGEQARGYFQKAQWAYEKVAPFLEGSEKEDAAQESMTHATGRFVSFDEENPLPTVLIKQAFFSMKLDQGEFAVNAIELTHQHWVRGQDSTLKISSTSNGDIKVDSRFKLTAANDFIADGNWSIQNRALLDASLTKSKAVTISIDKANMSGQGTFTIIEGSIIADNKLSLNNTKYQGQGTNKITNLLVDTIKSLDKLTIDVGVKGKLTKPSFSITSSLNDALTGAFKKQVAAKVDDFKLKVNKGLNKKLAEALKLGDNQTAELLDLEALLTDTDKALADLQNSDVVKQQKEKLKAKLKKKAEEKVKEKAKDKINDKLKGKLGDLFG